MSDAGPHDPIIETPKAETASRRISVVWLVPLLALLISLGVAYRSYSDRGPTIEVLFDDAAGIEAGKTTLRFRNVTVGVVESLRFTPDLRQVIATARMDKGMARYIDSTSEFWVVRPSVSAQGVTGIETIVSGVYIEAYWSGEAGPRVETFTALPRAPLTSADEPGRRIRLRAENGGSLTVGAPILFKRIPVGKIENVELTDTGDVMVDVFVSDPYDAFLTQGVRFWNASGFSINLGVGGASLNVESLVSLLQGGLAFAQVGSAIDEVADGHVFELYPSEAEARQNVIEDLPGARLTLNAFFDSSVSGLQPGAKVEYRGVTVGEVTEFQPVIIRRDAGSGLMMRVTMTVIPQRLGVPSDSADPTSAGLDLLADLVATDGLRAQLATSGLLSQSLYVNLAELEEAEPASLTRDAQPFPVLPTAPSEVAGIAASAENVMNRLSSLPIEELMNTFTTLLSNVNSLVTEDSFRAAPANLGALIADIREVVETSGIKETPAQIAATLSSIQTVVKDVETRELMASLAATLDTARVTIEKFGVAAEGVPALIGQVQDLPLDQFITSATSTVDGIDALVRSDSTAALPGSVDAALDEARGLISDLRTGGSVENVNASLLSLRQLTDELRAANLGAEIAKAVAAAERAAANVDTASAGLPELIDNLKALSGRVEGLPLDQLVTSATTVLDSADAFLGANGMDQVPQELAQSLEQVRLLISELREGGAVQNVNTTLASADQAAAAITAAAQRLPALITQLEAASVSANSALGTFTPGSQLTRETEQLIKELRTAAQSVNALVTALERRPNSVLFGR